MPAMRVAPRIFCGCLPLLLATGCLPVRPPLLAGAGMDMFTPVRVRLHPLSRLVPATAPTTAPAAPQAVAGVQARLEFTDQFGDIGKAAGSAHFELFAPAILGKGDKLAEWTTDINAPAANHQHWDAITRTYLFDLPLPAGLSPRDRSILSVTFTLPNGERLVDTLPLAAR